MTSELLIQLTNSHNWIREIPRQLVLIPQFGAPVDIVISFQLSIKRVLINQKPVLLKMLNRRRTPKKETASYGM